MKSQLVVAVEWDDLTGVLHCHFTNVGRTEVRIRPPIEQLDVRARGAGMFTFPLCTALHVLSYGVLTEVLGPGKSREYALQLREDVLWPSKGTFTVWVEYDALAKGLYWETGMPKPTNIVASSNEVQIEVDDRYSEL